MFQIKLLRAPENSLDFDQLDEILFLVFNFIV